MMGADAGQLDAGGCQPVCAQQGSAAEGWVNPCTSATYCTVECTGVTPRCDAIGTRSEGWYATGAGCGPSPDLIVWTDCSP